MTLKMIENFLNTENEIFQGKNSKKVVLFSCNQINTNKIVETFTLKNQID